MLAESVTASGDTSSNSLICLLGIANQRFEREVVLQKIVADYLTFTSQQLAHAPSRADLPPKQPFALRAREGDEEIASMLNLLVTKSHYKFGSVLACIEQVKIGRLFNVPSSFANLEFSYIVFGPAHME